MTLTREPSTEPARPLRVLMVCEYHAKYATNLARGLADHGCDIMLLSRDHEFEFGGDRGEAEPGALRRYVGEVLDGHGMHRELSGRVRDPRALGAVLARRRDVGTFAPDVVHLQESVWLDPRFFVAARTRRKRYAVTIHDPSLHPGESESFLERVGRRQSLRHAGLVFVHSRALKDELMEVARPTAPVVVVPHGTQLPAPTPVPPDPHLLFFGRFSIYKGIDVLLDAMPHVWAAVPDARLTLAGAGDLPAHPLLGDSRIVVRHEHVREEQVPALFSSARVVVLPYRQASQSGVGSRAKTYGRGIVVTDVGGLAELVSDGSGEVVPSEDPAVLAEVLATILTVPGRAEELGRRAADGAAESSWPRVSELTLAAYRDHLGANC
jgi:glycosyltransferase involved in cell wall biosynthesis